MGDRVYNVLFLCTHNSARSVIAEAILNGIGQPHFRGYSAGSHPKGAVHPYALDLLERLNYDLTPLRSKSWNEFAAPGTPRLDFIFTVCDDASNEVCPVWPGQPMTAHWGVSDPSRAEGSESVVRRAFADTHRILHERISAFIKLPLAALDELTLQRRLDDISRSGCADEHEVGA